MLVGFCLGDRRRRRWLGGLEGQAHAVLLVAQARPFPLVVGNMDTPSTGPGISGYSGPAASAHIDFTASPGWRRAPRKRALSRTALAIAGSFPSSAAWCGRLSSAPEATTKAPQAAVPGAGPSLSVCPTWALSTFGKCGRWGLGGGRRRSPASLPCAPEPVLRAAADKDKGLWAPADLACQRPRPTLPSLLIKVGLCSPDRAPHFRMLCWRLI